jgi:hypothetical protein
MEPYSKKVGKFRIDDSNSKNKTKKLKEEIKNANRSLKKSVRQNAKNEIRKKL